MKEKVKEGINKVLQNLTKYIGNQKSNKNNDNDKVLTKRKRIENALNDIINLIFNEFGRCSICKECECLKNSKEEIKNKSNNSFEVKKYNSYIEKRDSDMFSNSISNKKIYTEEYIKEFNELKDYMNNLSLLELKKIKKSKESIDENYYSLEKTNSLANSKKPNKNSFNIFESLSKIHSNYINHCDKNPEDGERSINGLNSDKKLSQRNDLYFENYPNIYENSAGEEFENKLKFELDEFNIKESFNFLPNNINTIEEQYTSEDELEIINPIEINLSDLLEIELPEDKNPLFPFSKEKLELLTLDKNEKINKFFNSKLVSQKCNKKVDPLLKKGIKIKEFGFILIYDCRLYMKFFIIIDKTYYTICINCKNKRFKECEGFDYFSEISYKEFFFLCILKFIINYNKKDATGLFQYFITSIKPYGLDSLISTKLNSQNKEELIISPAINLKSTYSLNFRQYYFSNECLEYICLGLSDCRFITELSLEENKLNDKSMVILSKALKSEHCSIKTLGLNYNSIGDKGAQTLALSLLNNKKVKTLGLYHNELSDLGATSIGQLFKKNNTLEIINLSKNNLRFNGLKSLFEGLKENRSLKSIGLEYSKIDDEGAEEIKQLLIENETLEGINLSNNDIGDDGFALISEGLAINKKLSVLSIRRNRISNQGIIDFSKALKTNKSLTNVFLQDNNIGNEGGKSLVEYLNYNRTIQNIYLYENSLNFEIKELIRAVENRIKV